MYSNNRLRNIEIPENLFSNLGESKKNETKKNNTYNIDNEPKLTNFSKHKEYRDRINKMYDNIENLTPVDGEIDNILYFNNYIERGIVVKPKVSSLKQFWTEYRLITNEKKLPRYHLNSNDKNEDNKEKENRFIPKNIELNEDIKVEDVIETKEIKEEVPKAIIEETEFDNKTLTNFDELFESLSSRVNEINKYIDELKEMRAEINNSKNQLEQDKEQLKEEKQEFLEFKEEEKTKIEKEKENLKINFNRLQTIIDDLDKKLNEIEK